MNKEDQDDLRWKWEEICLQSLTKAEDVWSHSCVSPFRGISFSHPTPRRVQGNLMKWMCILQAVNGNHESIPAHLQGVMILKVVGCMVGYKSGNVGGVFFCEFP